MYLYYNTAMAVIHGHNKLANPTYLQKFIRLCVWLMIIVGAFMFGIVLTENIKLRKEMQVANQSIKALRTIESIKNIEP